MTQVRLDKFNNAHYHPGSVSKRCTWYVFSLLFFENGLPWPSAMRMGILKLFGARVGKGVVIKPRVRIKYPWKLSLGAHTWVGEGVWIDNLDQVDIGAHCCVSQGAFILCGNHDYTKPTFDLITASVSMEDGSWAGAKSLLGPGAVLRKEAVLAAGSVGLGELEAHKVHQGNPAKVVRDRIIDP